MPAILPAAASVTVQSANGPHLVNPTHRRADPLMYTRLVYTRLGPQVVIYTSAASPGNLFANDVITANQFLDQLGAVSWAAFCLSHAFT